MESDEPPRIVALGASGRISRREVIARPQTPGFTSGPSTTPNPHPHTGYHLGPFGTPAWTIADWRRIG